MDKKVPNIVLITGTLEHSITLVNILKNRPSQATLKMDLARVVKLQMLTLAVARSKPATVK